MRPRGEYDVIRVIACNTHVTHGLTEYAQTEIQGRFERAWQLAKKRCEGAHEFRPASTTANWFRHT